MAARERPSPGPTMQSAARFRAPLTVYHTSIAPWLIDQPGGSGGFPHERIWRHSFNFFASRSLARERRPRAVSGSRPSSTPICRNDISLK